MIYWQLDREFEPGCIQRGFTESGVYLSGTRHFLGEVKNLPWTDNKKLEDQGRPLCPHNGRPLPDDSDDKA